MTMSRGTHGHDGRVKIENKRPRFGVMAVTWAFGLERVKGIEPSMSAWEPYSVPALADDVGSLCGRDESGLAYAGRVAGPWMARVEFTNRRSLRRRRDRTSYVTTGRSRGSRAGDWLRVFVGSEDF